MKILNVVLSVLILVLAVASAVFSYLLFEKREQMTTGYEKMAGSIAKLAMQIDSTSGTNNASDLSVANLSHQKFDKLSGNLSKFENAVGQVISERNDLAASVRTIAASVIPDESLIPSEADLTNIATSKESAAKVEQEIADYKARQDKLAAFLVATAAKLDVKITPTNLVDRTTETTLKHIDTEFQSTLKRLAQHQNALDAISLATGGQKNDFNPRKYENTIAQVTAAVDAFKKKYDDVNGQLILKENQIKELRTDLTKKDNEIVSRNTTIDKLQLDINRLKEVINPGDASAVPALWADGSADVRKVTEGKVLEINDKFGFIVLDLGKNTRVPQKLGVDKATGEVKTTEIDPKITNGMTMVVSRSLDKDVEYIGRITIFRVDDDCAFAQIEKGSDKKVHVGDTVYFSESDIAKTVGQ